MNASYARIGRLAPTPSGRLHLGNVCAFAAAWLSARGAGGRLLLRIEDVDTPRARIDTATSLRADLAWLGFDWDHEVAPQSARDYAPWLARLAPSLYHCGCTRAAVRGTGGVYRGTCRDRGLRAGALRFRLPDRLVAFVDRAKGPQAVDLSSQADPVLRRRDGVYAYPLAVVADDVADGVTEVVRGADLLDQCGVQTILWRAFGATPPTWLHTPLILGADGRKLSKSHRSACVGDLRDAGWPAREVWRVALPWLGISRSRLARGGPGAIRPRARAARPLHLDPAGAGAGARLTPSIVHEVPCPFRPVPSAVPASPSPL